MNADQIKALLDGATPSMIRMNLANRISGGVFAVIVDRLIGAINTIEDAGELEISAIHSAMTVKKRNVILTTENEALRKRVAELETIASAWAETAQHCEILEGVCCCGDNMENHPSPMNCGHSPVDHGAYHAAQLLDQTIALLSKGTPDAKP